MIQFRCPGCQTEIETPDEYAGRTARCPTCNRRIHVPRKSPSAGDRDEAEPDDETSRSTTIFRVGGRTYEVRPRLEGLLVAAAAVIALSIVVLVAVGLTAPVYTPWFVAGLVAAGFALFGALLVIPAYYNIRRSRGRKSGERLAFINVAVAAVLIVAFLCLAMMWQFVVADNTPCHARLEAVYKAIVEYAAKNDGLLPPRPETLVELGYLKASKLTCPKVPNTREGTPTYDRLSYIPLIDFRFPDEVSRGFPRELIILMGGGLHTIRDKDTGQDVLGYYVLRLDGTVGYIEQDRKNDELKEQQKIVRRVLADRISLNPGGPDEEPTPDEAERTAQPPSTDEPRPEGDETPPAEDGTPPPGNETREPDDSEFRIP